MGKFQLIDTSVWSIMARMKKVTVKSIIWKEGKFFVAQCLSVDVSSFGNTKKQALTNLKEALELFFEGQKSPKITSIKSPMITTTALQYV